jgi:pyruvate dehydrogenase E2 component (dihydrolipoamide acetyltransferase)
MAREVVLPKLGQTMQEGTVVNIRFEAGNCVTAGDILFDIETDKATLEIESETGGFVKAVLVEPGQTVPVHTPLMILGREEEQLDSAYLAQIASHVRNAVKIDSSVQQVSDAACAGPISKANIGGGGSIDPDTEDRG